MLQAGASLTLKLATALTVIAGSKGIPSHRLELSDLFYVVALANHDMHLSQK